jgi:hypothetical protein
MAQVASAQAPTPAPSMEVAAPAAKEPGLLESVVSSILGFLFG